MSRAREGGPERGRSDGDGPVPERWLVLTLACPADPELSGLVVEELLSMGPRGVEETADGLVVYLPDPEEESVEDLIQGLRSRLERLLGTRPPIAHRWQPHEEWRQTWRRGLGARRVTPRVVVSPSWVDPELGPGELLVTVDPGMAFGTAEHPTTRGAIRLLDRLVEPRQRVADVGSGSGILSITAARLGAEHVVAWEMDGWACEAARENMELNGVEGVVEVVHAAVDPSTFDGRPPFHGIVANIESQVLLPLLPAFHGALLQGGWLILSGILEAEASELRGRAESTGFEFVAEDLSGGWWTGAFRAPP
jgi:ribosomal protein L11 methyltransferase